MTIASPTTDFTPRSGDDVAALARSMQALEQRAQAITELADALEPLVALARQMPALIAMLGDSFDDVMRKALDDGLDVERGLLNGTAAALRFGATMDEERVRELDALLQSGVLAPSTLRTIGQMSAALTDAASAPPRAIGVVELLKALRNPDVQRALGFLIIFAQRFGHRLAPAPSARG
jgi:uncharacterized protein YjgD (DUF1641 family)